MVEVCGKEYSKLGIEEDGTIYLKTKRQIPGKKYNITSLRFREVLWTMWRIHELALKGTTIIEKLEGPALAYWIRYGLYKGDIGGGAARDQSRLIKDIYSIISGDIMMLFLAASAEGRVKSDVSMSPIDIPTNLNDIPIEDCDAVIEGVPYTEERKNND